MWVSGTSRLSGGYGSHPMELANRSSLQAKLSLDFLSEASGFSLWGRQKGKCLNLKMTREASPERLSPACLFAPAWSSPFVVWGAFPEPDWARSSWFFSPVLSAVQDPGLGHMGVKVSWLFDQAISTPSVSSGANKLAPYFQNRSNGSRDSHNDPGSFLPATITRCCRWDSCQWEHSWLGFSPLQMHERRQTCVSVRWTYFTWWSAEMEGGTYASCLDRSTNLTLAEMFQPAVLFDWMLFFFFPLFPDCKRSCSPVGLPPPKRNPPHVGAGQAPAWPWRTSKYCLLLVGGAVGVVHLRRMSHPVLVCFFWAIGGVGVRGQVRPDGLNVSLWVVLICLDESGTRAEVWGLFLTLINKTNSQLSPRSRGFMVGVWAELWPEAALLQFSSSIFTSGLSV